MNSYLIISFLSIISILDSFENNKARYFNDDEISYFTETAFYKKAWLSRWEKNIEVQCSGNFNSQDKKHIEQIISEIAPYLGSTHIQLVDDGGNLLIHFENDLSNFNASPLFKDKKVPFGYMLPKLNSKHQFVKADIYIHPFLKGNKKQETLMHEFCHSLGLLSHANRAFEKNNLLGKIIFGNQSAFENWSSNQQIPHLDRRAISILYQNNLPLNCSKVVFDNKYKAKLQNVMSM